MEGKKIRAIGTSLILCLAAMNISGCGSKDSEFNKCSNGACDKYFRHADSDGSYG